MSEELLKIELAELLHTIRLKRQDGVILEAADLASVRACCGELRQANSHAAQILTRFFDLAEQISDPAFPVKVEFAVKAK